MEKLIGLTVTPTRFVYDGLQTETSGIPDDIQFTLNITHAGVAYGIPVFLQADSAWIGINDLIFPIILTTFLGLIVAVVAVKLYGRLPSVRASDPNLHPPGDLPAAGV